MVCRGARGWPGPRPRPPYRWGPPEGGAGARIAVRPLTRLKKLVWQSSRLAPFVEELGAVITASHHPADVLQPMVWLAQAPFLFVFAALQTLFRLPVGI